jgi:hypothetical protein
MVFGLGVNVWVFTPHEWNLDWLVNVVTLPGVWLGALVWMALGSYEAFAVPCIISGLATQWLLIGILAGTVAYLFQARRLHLTTPCTRTPR